MFSKKIDKLNKYDIDDKLFAYYTTDKNSIRFENGKAIVSFNVEEIIITTNITNKGEKVLIEYDGYKIGCNYYGVFPEHLVAPTKKELAIKLIEQGIIYGD